MRRFVSFLLLAAALCSLMSVGVSASFEYSFGGVKDTDFLPSTDYEDIYGAQYIYGGQNVIDYDVPDLPYEVYAIKVDHTTVETAAAEPLRKARQLHTDKEKVILLNEWICDHMIYNSKVFASPDEIAGASEPVEGNCASYAYLMNYLCGRLGIPCIMIFGESHCWNMIWADGAWGYTDVSYNDLVYDHAGILFDDTAPKQPSNPDGNRFLMELLVPGSTK